MNESRASICAVITESSVETARQSMAQAAVVADFIELRLDYLRDFDFTDPASLLPLLQHKSRPVIITCRDISEGGVQAIADETRLRLLVEGARHLADYCDIEAPHYEAAAKLRPDISKLIV